MDDTVPTYRGIDDLRIAIDKRGLGERWGPWRLSCSCSMFREERVNIRSAQLLHTYGVDTARP